MFANRWFWPVPARTPRAICILKMCIDDLERAGWGVGWHDLGALGVGRADGTRGPADRRGAPRVGERPANAGGRETPSIQLRSRFTPRALVATLTKPVNIG